MICLGFRYVPEHWWFMLDGAPLHSSLTKLEFLHMFSSWFLPVWRTSNFQNERMVLSQRGGSSSPMFTWTLFFILMHSIPTCICARPYKLQLFMTHRDVDSVLQIFWLVWQEGHMPLALTCNTHVQICWLGQQPIHITSSLVYCPSKSSESP
jgi:hypothetical protein